MGAYEDYKDDWRCDEFVEEVSLLPPEDYEGQNPTEGVMARRGEVGISPFGGLVAVEPGEAAWVVFVDTFPDPADFRFGPGVLIKVSDQEVWEVQRCTLTVAGTRYFCAARLRPAR